MQDIQTLLHYCIVRCRRSLVFGNRCALVRNRFVVEHMFVAYLRFRVPGRTEIVSSVAMKPSWSRCETTGTVQGTTGTSDVQRGAAHCPQMSWPRRFVLEWFEYFYSLTWLRRLLAYTTDTESVCGQGSSRKHTLQRALIEVVCNPKGSPVLQRWVWVCATVGARFPPIALALAGQPKPKIWARLWLVGYPNLTWK